jgi:hypothetical protein
MVKNFLLHLPIFTTFTDVTAFTDFTAEKTLQLISEDRQREHTHTNINTRMHILYIVIPGRKGRECR